MQILLNLMISCSRVVRGLLSLRASLVAASLTPREEIGRHLHTYLLSHGIHDRNTSLANLLASNITDVAAAPSASLPPPPVSPEKEAQAPVASTSGGVGISSEKWFASSQPSASKMATGREGERIVYFAFLDRIKQSQNFDFDTGHPLLGCGRVLDVRWVNEESESRKPYDLAVFLEGGAQSLVNI